MGSPYWKRSLSPLVLFVAVTALLLATGCGSSGPEKPSNTANNEFEGAPDWVVKGCAAYFGDKTAICGVGSAAGSRNISMLRTAAQGRGRTEIARSLSLQVKSMLKDYQSTTTGGEYFGEQANDEQHIEDVSKQVTNITLSGTRLEDTWVSNSGTLYALMVLNLEAFKDSIQKMGQLDERVRAAVVERADKGFAELDKETAE